MEVISAASMAILSDFTGQNLSNTAWACATLEMTIAPLMNAIASAAIAISRQLDPQSLANTAWAFAAIEFRHMPLMAVIASQSLRSIGDWTAVELSSFAWSYARLGWRNVPLMHASAACASTQLSELTLLDIANTVWAFEALEIPPGARLRSLINAHGLEGFVADAVKNVRNHGIEMVHLANSGNLGPKAVRHYPSLHSVAGLQPWPPHGSISD